MAEIPRGNPQDIKRNPIGPVVEKAKQNRLARRAKVIAVWERELPGGRTEITVFDSNDPYHGYIRTLDNYNHPCG